MQKASSLQAKGWQNFLFFVIALVIVVADQLSKMWIRSYPEGHTIFDAGFFQIIRLQNTGAAFGLFQGQSFALTIIAILGVAVFIIFVLLMRHHLSFLDNILSRSTLGLVLGGTIGNLIDRLCYGSVTDFIDFGFWPAFNIADSAITVGVILFAYSSLRSLAMGEKHKDG